MPFPLDIAINRFFSSKRHTFYISYLDSLSILIFTADQDNALLSIRRGKLPSAGFLSKVMRRYSRQGAAFDLDPLETPT